MKSSIHITGKATTLETGSPGPIRQVRLDPEHEYLLLRHLGENVKFELRAPSAKEVALSGGFAIKPVPAVRHGDTWTVEMPMVDGRYNWVWQIDGKAAEPHSNLEGQPLTGVRFVKAVSEMESAYPR